MVDLSAFPIIRKWPARHPERLQLYSLPTPNGVKVSIMLEETGLPYEAQRVEFSPVRWACRTGVCHNCETGLIADAVVYRPDPLDPPADGNLLICCSQPQGDIALDL